MFSSLVAGASPQPATAAIQYVVQPGDTLRSIARDQYGDAELWQTIYQANRSTIGPNPDALVAGKTLQIPARQ
jgi:nucleoid-associated protein YgaU